MHNVNADKFKENHTHHQSASVADINLFSTYKSPPSLSLARARARTHTHTHTHIRTHACATHTNTHTHTHTGP